MKKRNLLLIIFIGIFICLFIIGTFFDLEISKAIATPNNLFGIIFASLGELPAYGGVAFACGALLMYALKFIKKDFLKGFVIGFASVMVLVPCYFQGGAFTSVNAWGAYNINFNKLYFSLPIGILLMTPFFILGLILVKKCENREIIYPLIVMSIVFFISMMYAPVLKPVFHRPRYRFLAASDRFDLFHPWYKPFSDYAAYKGLTADTDAFVSFPSGHTGSAMCAVCFFYFLPKFMPKLKEKDVILMVIGFVYAAFIGFTRINVGAHFLTDVTFSGSFVLIVYTLF